MVLGPNKRIESIEVNFAYDWSGFKFPLGKQCLTLGFYGESKFKKITNLPTDHEIIGVEGRICCTSITSLSLLIAGPSMDMLSKQEKKA